MTRVSRGEQQRLNRVLLRDAAERVFAERGVMGASLDDVAFEAVHLVVAQTPQCWQPLRMGLLVSVSASQIGHVKRSFSSHDLNYSALLQ